MPNNVMPESVLRLASTLVLKAATAGPDAPVQLAAIDPQRLLDTRGHTLAAPLTAEELAEAAAWLSDTFTVDLTELVDRIRALRAA